MFRLSGLCCVIHIYLFVQCIVPCLVQLLPKDSVLVRCIRAYARYRIMIGLHCMTEDRIDRLKQYIINYKDICTVSILSVFAVHTSTDINFRECLKFTAKTSIFISSMLFATSLKILNKRGQLII